MTKKGPVLALCKHCGDRFQDYSGKGVCSSCVGKKETTKK